MGVPSLYFDKHCPITHLLVWASSGSAWPLTWSVLITRPYHWPGTQLNLTAGPATDLRGYEPNEPAHWWDGFRQVIPESPWGALPQSHSSPPSASSLFPSILCWALLHSLPSFFQKSACEKQLHVFFLLFIFHISCMFHRLLLLIVQSVVLGEIFVRHELWNYMLECWWCFPYKLKSVNDLGTTRRFRNKLFNMILPVETWSCTALCIDYGLWTA